MRPEEALAGVGGTAGPVLRCEAPTDTPWVDPETGSIAVPPDAGLDGLAEPAFKSTTTPWTIDCACPCAQRLPYRQVGASDLVTEATRIRCECNSGPGPARMNTTLEMTFEVQGTVAPAAEGTGACEAVVMLK
ncbi:MAG: hypothetical protein JXB32_18765 [Deltaproteobacteria bacterium]|nr:hypothetical protein [Deltaproteobacteria bacterium]